MPRARSTPLHMTSTPNLIRKVADFYKTHGWTRGANFRHAPEISHLSLLYSHAVDRVRAGHPICACLNGAMMLSLGGDSAESYKRVEKAFRTPGLFRDDHKLPIPYIAWNDTIATSKKQVQRKLRNIARAMEKRAA